jgi:hypothetical protein
LKVDRNTVWRARKGVRVERTSQTESSRKLGASAGFGATFGSIVPEISAGASASNTKSEKVNVHAEGGSIDVEHSTDPDGNHRYTCAPSSENTVAGHAFPSGQKI